MTLEEAGGRRQKTEGSRSAGEGRRESELSQIQDPRQKKFHHEGHEGHEEMKFDDLSHSVIGCALEVHSHSGPGLLESTYEQCLAHELTM
ncbi:MAG: GxxExxY protein, partial [Pseudomonadota bacterium]|nr:GxxExxY protein [Pseudomonadota bacterium]